MTDHYNSASAAYANYEDIEILRRQLEAAQSKIAVHEEMLTLIGHSLASGDRMFAAIERSLTVHFQLLCLLVLSVIAIGVMGVTL